MTDFADFCASLKDYANRQDWSDVLTTSFVRDAEQKINAELRIDRQICVAKNTVTDQCSTLPDNWLESDFMLMSANTPTGWFPIRYKPRDQFFRTDNPSTSTISTASNSTTYGQYTIEGRVIFFGGPPDAIEGNVYQLSYYSEVPVFSDTQDSWLYTKFPSLYRFAALMHADLHAVGEEDKAGGLKMLVEDQIKKLNDAHRLSRASGSRLSRGHTRSFG